MKNKEFYRFYQTEPFLETVSEDTSATSEILTWFFVRAVSVYSAVSPFLGWQACNTRLSATAHSNWTGPSRAAVLSASSHALRHLPLPFWLPFFTLLSTRYLVVFNPIEQERLCVVTVLVNTVKVRVLTEDGQTLPVQLSAQWSSASQMNAEVFEVRGWIC